VKVHDGLRFRSPLPLPAFVLHPLTALIIACVHVYLAAGHLSRLFGGETTWTNIWKGFGALAGAYVFVALGSRGIVAQRKDHQHPTLEPDGTGANPRAGV
jgi:hypothetical protein